MPTLILLILAVNAVATLLAGAIMYITGKTKMQNAIWLVYNTLFCIWNFCFYKALASTETTITLYWFSGVLVSIIFMAPVFLHFLSVYSDREVFKRQIIVGIYVLFFLIFATFLFMPIEFITGIRSGTYLKSIISPGMPFHIFTFIFIGFVFCGFYYLMHSGKEYLNFRRNQRAWLFFGMFFGMLAPLSFFISIYRVTSLPFGLFFVIPYLGLVSYAMLKYHVLEINVLINKMTLLAYTTLFIIFIHMLAVHILHRIIGVAYFESSAISGCIILLNLLFTVHYGGILRLSRAANRIVYEKRFDYYKFLEEFNAMVDKTKDLDILLYYIVDSLVSMVGVECVSLYLFDEETAKFRLRASSGINGGKVRELGDISKKSPLIDFLKQGNIFVVRESEDFAQDYDLEEIRKAFSKVNVKLTIPLYHSMPLYYARDIVGFLNLGDKKDRTDYSKEDIDILNAIGRQIGICLASASLLSQSIEDDLTKLYRHSYLHKRIEEEISRGKRYNRVFSLLMIDIDNFKKINDIFGHQVGDEVLRRVARILKSSLRKTDIAARYGGEEFGILMPETDKTKAFIVAERIRVRIEEEFATVSNVKEITGDKFSKMADFHVRVSIGVSAYRPDIEKYQLIREADEALYRAKAQGKNKVC